MLMSEDDWHDYGAEMAYENRREHAMDVYDNLMRVTDADMFWQEGDRIKYDCPDWGYSYLTQEDIEEVAKLSRFEPYYVWELIEEFLIT